MSAAEDSSMMVVGDRVGETAVTAGGGEGGSASAAAAGWLSAAHGYAPPSEWQWAAKACGGREMHLDCVFCELITIKFGLNLSCAVVQGTGARQK